MPTESLSRAKIQAEIERVENALDDLEADVKETFEYESYLQGLRFALGEYNPPTDTLPSVKTIDTIVSTAQEEFPENNIYVERESTPPQYEHIGIIMEVNTNSLEEWNTYSDRLTEIARQEENEDELVYTRAKRLRKNTNNPNSTQSTTD